ncbi:MAG TPA: hypothetical protein VF338_03375 [Leptolinea sp.]
MPERPAKMSMEYNDSGKFFTEVIRKKPVRVIIQTTQQVIHGNVHIRPEARLKDEIDQDELSLAITDAVVFGNAGEILYESKFLAVNRRQIVWIIPQEELAEIKTE